MFARRPYLVSLLCTILGTFAILAGLILAVAVAGFLGALGAKNPVLEYAARAGILGGLGIYLIYQSAFLYHSANVKLGTRVAAVLAVVPTALLGLLLAVALLIPATKIQVTGPIIDVIIGVPLVYLAVFVFFVAVFTFASSAGGYARAFRSFRAEREADRQSLLKRVFEIRSQLDESEQAASVPVAPIASPLAAPLPRTNPYLLVFVTACGFQTLGVLLISIWWVFIRPRTGMTGDIATIITMPLFVLAVLAMLQVGSLLRGIGAALRAVPLIVLGIGFSYLVRALIPIGYKPTERHIPTITGEIWSLAFTSVMFALPVVAGAMTRSYAEFLDKQRKLDSRDREALLAEIKRIRSRLGDEVRQGTYLCVDVVGSTAMKNDADPLAIEYSFTEFHRYIAQRALEFGGAVRSTAGDGALITFPDANSAVSAGLAIQRGLDGFNAGGNRLPAPFCLRIGINTGSVHGEATGVAFADAIDIAAHVEKACPVGQVCVTHQTIEHLFPLPSHTWLDLKVDGCPVAMMDFEDE